MRADYTPQANGQLSFLPWHRYFLRMVERELQKVSFCQISIPYFEWTVDAGSLQTSAGWQTNFFGGDGDPRTGCVTHHPFQTKSSWSPCLRRNFNTSLHLPDAVSIQLALAEEDFLHFSSQLQAISALFHLWVGGHMASPFSPYDPVFLSHYAFMDKLWTHWQERHDGLSHYPVEQRYVKMKPFDVAPDDVLLFQQQMCSLYVPITLGAPCNITTPQKPTRFDKASHNKRGFNSKAYDPFSLRKDGLEERVDSDHRSKYDKKGYNRHGYDRSGFDQMGWDKYGYGRDSFDRDHFDADGYDIFGYNRYGYNRSNVATFGMKWNGTFVSSRSREVEHLLFKDGYNKYGFDKFGLDRNGFDVFGFRTSGYDKDCCNFFFRGPHYLRFYFFAQLQISMVGPGMLSKIKRICPPITPLPANWLIHNWMVLDPQEDLVQIRHIEEEWTIQHPFDRDYVPNISSVKDNGLWLPVTPDLRLCFELRWFSGCPLGAAPVNCPDLCRSARCPGYPEAECRLNNCGSCFTEWYDRTTGSHVMCQGW
ncbi:kielin/chordin-like protein [Arapaima gigas]